MINKNSSTLYIATRSDTIENIAEKFNITTTIIYQFNPLLKNHHLYEGMPLIIPFQNDYRNINLQKTNNIKFETIYCYRILIEETFYSINNDILHDKIKNNANKIIKQIDSIEDIRNNIQILINDLLNYNFQIINSLSIQKVDKIKKVLLDKKTLFNNYYAILKRDSSNNILEIIKSIDELWQKFILKFSSNQINDAEKIFDRIVTLAR